MRVRGMRGPLSFAEPSFFSLPASPPLSLRSSAASFEIVSPLSRPAPVEVEAGHLSVRGAVSTAPRVSRIREGTASVAVCRASS